MNNVGSRFLKLNIRTVVNVVVATKKQDADFNQTSNTVKEYFLNFRNSVARFLNS